MSVVEEVIVDIPTTSIEYEIELKRHMILNEVFHKMGIPMLKIEDHWYQFDISNYVYEIVENNEKVSVKYRKRNSRYERAVRKKYEWDVEIRVMEIKK